MPKLRPRSRRQISAAAISLDKLLFLRLPPSTKREVANNVTLTLAEFASSLVRPWLIPSLPAAPLNYNSTIFHPSEKVYDIILSFLREKSAGHATLQSGRQTKCEKFQRGRHYAEKVYHHFLSLVFPQRQFSQPRLRHKREVFLLCQIVSGKSRCATFLSCAFCGVPKINGTEKDEMTYGKWQTKIDCYADYNDKIVYVACYYLLSSEIDWQK